MLVGLTGRVDLGGAEDRQRWLRDPVKQPELVEPDHDERERRQRREPADPAPLFEVASGDRWCQKPVLSTFRRIFPLGHRFGDSCA